MSLQKELKRLMADKQKAESLIVSLGMQVEKTSRRPGRAGAVSDSGPACRGENHRQELEGADRDPERAARVDEYPVAAGRRRHDLGGQEEPDGPPGRDRYRAACRSRPKTATGSSRSRCPTTTWGRSWLPRAKLDADIKAGRKKPSDTLPAYFVTMTDPEHRYEGYVVRMAPGAETMAESEQYKNRHIVKVTIGFSEAVRQDYLKRNEIKVMRPGAEVRPGSIAGRPIWPITCSASRSRSSTNRCCSAGRSCTERSPSGRPDGGPVRRTNSRRVNRRSAKPGKTPGCEEKRLIMSLSKPIAALAAGCCANERGGTGADRRAAPGPPAAGVQADRLCRAGADRLDRTVGRGRASRRRHPEHGAPDRHAGQEGRHDRHLASRDGRADRQEKQAAGRQHGPDREGGGPAGSRRFRSWPATCGSTSGRPAWSRRKMSPRPRVSSRSPRPRSIEAQENQGDRRGRSEAGDSDAQGAHDRRSV